MSSEPQYLAHCLYTKTIDTLFNPSKGNNSET